MTKVFIFLFICAMSSVGFAAAIPESIAIEFQEKGKFTGIVGKAYVTETAIEVVTFAEQNGVIIPFAFIDTILEKESNTEGVYRIKSRNQLGVLSTGRLDLRNRLNPKIILTTDKGITVTNISSDGRKMKNKFLPKVDLGK